MSKSPVIPFPFFALDLAFFDNHKIDALHEKCGNDGLIVLLAIWVEIQKLGGRLDPNDTVRLNHIRRTRARVDHEVFLKCTSSILELNLICTSGQDQVWIKHEISDRLAKTAEIRTLQSKGGKSTQSRAKDDLKSTSSIPKDKLKSSSRDKKRIEESRGETLSERYNVSPTTSVSTQSTQDPAEPLGGSPSLGSQVAEQPDQEKKYRASQVKIFATKVGKVGLKFDDELKAEVDKVLTVNISPMASELHREFLIEDKTADKQEVMQIIQSWI